VEKIKKIWQNEYFKTAISILSVFLLFLIFWYGSIAYFNTENPYLVVSSGSMRPTLEVGDLIIVKWVPPSQLHGNPLNGDIIVYESDEGDLRVHRLIKIVPSDKGGYFLTTKGDANDRSLPDEINFSDKRYIGKVIARIPFIGHISLFTHTRQGFYFFLFVIICLIIIFIAFPSSKEAEEEEEIHKQQKGGVLHKILNFNFIVFLMVNLLITGFLVFSLWGSFSFWQPGAERGFQWVTIRGMYPDTEFHKNFIKLYLPKVEETILQHGFFTYKIDCRMDNGEIRTGVPTFSWAQFSILILILVNLWMLTMFLPSKKASVPERKSEI